MYTSDTAVIHKVRAMVSMVMVWLDPVIKATFKVILPKQAFCEILQVVSRAVVDLLAVFKIP